MKAPLIGMFFMSTMIPFINLYGLFAGATSGFLIVAWIGIGSFIVKPLYPKLPVSVAECVNQTTLLDLNISNNPLSQAAMNLTGFNKIYSLSYMWLSTVGVSTTIIIGIIVSLSTRKFAKRTKVDDKFIIYRSFKNRNDLNKNIK